MDDQFCVVPFWGIPSPEADNLLSDCFIGYVDNSPPKATSRYADRDSKLSKGHLLGDDLEDVLERIFASTAIRNDGQFLCNVDGGSDRSSYYDDSDISWLDEFMNVYGITTLDSNDDFNMKSINDNFNMKKTNVDMTVVTTPGAKENHPAIMLTSMEGMKNDEILTNTTQSGTVKVLDDNVHQKRNTVPSSNQGQKFAVNRTCFDGISERKRAQNRCAAIRYRGKRREKAKQKKQELHKLELRNIELKAEMNCLEKEVIYLKSLMERNASKFICDSLKS
ncbi:unnamed protein product [Cercopithifilaria johnstoni]|uniref:BZIP domain-containing protein n=1 Tax=Cercopithifilaria johnstoni TaxID=2874296 RepID=A0A8J2LQC1_9BILA|nr:unnamed protein product [Cercopithifilaria johnstoni]